MESLSFPHSYTASQHTKMNLNAKKKLDYSVVRINTNDT